MFGINMPSASEKRLLRLQAVFSRQTPVDSLTSLTEAISPPEKNFDNLASAAIALDANVILRLPMDDKGTDVVDYIGQRFDGPLIIPSQVVQEFWNNSLAVIETVGKKLKKQLNLLNKEGANLGSEFEDFAQRINDLSGDIDKNLGYLYDEKTTHKVKNFLETLMEKADLSTIDRMRFFPFAQMRMMTKTPPGFRDDGDGDFYVWTELLYGAMKAIDDGKEYDRLILVTNDAKIDWVREGVPHPILSAEANELLKKPFEIWTLKDFIKAVEKELNA